MSQKSKIEDQLAYYLTDCGIPFEREYRFAPRRLYRADFHILDTNILVECEGGIWTGGRHTTGAGFSQDCEKYNLASLLGFRVFRFTSAMVESGEALDVIEKARKAK